MSQFIRPDANITQTLYTNGYAEIDEVSASTADFAYAAVNDATPVLEVSLSNPAQDPGGSIAIVSWMAAKRNGNGNINGGNSFNATCALIDGTTEVASDTYTPGDWATRTFTFDPTSLVNCDNLRLRFTQTASGGNNANQHSGLAVAWAQVELPNAYQVVLIQ